VEKKTRVEMKKREKNEKMKLHAVLSSSSVAESSFATLSFVT